MSVSNQCDNTPIFERPSGTNCALLREDNGTPIVIIYNFWVSHFKVK